MKTRKHAVVVFDLPLPPEAAALGGPEFGSWLAAASAEVARHRSQPLAGAVAVKAFVGIGADRRDINKIGGLLIDVLTVSGAIGAGCVSDLSMRFDRTVAADRLRVELKGVNRPEVRLSADARATVSRAARARWDEYRAARSWTRGEAAR